MFSTRSSSDRKPRVSMDVGCTHAGMASVDWMHATTDVQDIREACGLSGSVVCYSPYRADLQVHGAKHAAHGVRDELGARRHLIMALARHFLHVAALLLEELRESSGHTSQGVQQGR